MDEKGEKIEDRAVGSEKEREPEIEIVEAEPEPEKGKEEKAVKVKKRKEELKIVEEIPPKVRPHIDKETRVLLELRRARRSKRPPFLRQEWFRYKRLGMKWRRPQGQ